MTNIKIDRLEIRLKGGKKQIARDLTSGLGAEIIRQLSNREILQSNIDVIRMEEIRLDPIQFSYGDGPSALKKAIGNRVAEFITSHANNQKKDNQQ